MTDAWAISAENCYQLKKIIILFLMKSYFKLLMFVCTILLLSCNKEKNENIISNESEYYIEKLYYIDNVKVDNFNDFSLSQKSDSL